MKPLLKIILFFIISASVGFSKSINVLAQSEVAWSPPVNLSNSGSSTAPVMTIDLAGIFHVIWIDAYDGYKYTQSIDGVNWTSPKSVNFPFEPEIDSTPTFVVTTDGLVNVFWQDGNNGLNYNQAHSQDFGNPSAWSQTQKIAESVLNFDVVADDTGVLHLAYMRNKSDNVDAAGVYYRYRDASGWSPVENLYTSQYFRSLSSENAHVRIAQTTSNNASSIYVVWDDRQQKRIFLDKSSDSGKTWGQSKQIWGPEETSGIEYPFNIEVTVHESDALLLWQLGIPGGQCTQYSQWSANGGENFEDPVRMLDEFSLCPQRSEPIFQNSDFSVVSLINQNDFSLMAWDGSRWSDVMPQSEISTFINPVTFDVVLLSCQVIVENGTSLYFVGCDEGAGGDIWFSSRPLGSLETWFPPLSEWVPPVIIASGNATFSNLTLTADSEDKVHAFWVQSSMSDAGIEEISIQYSQWNGVNWSSPVTVIAGLKGKPLQLTVSADTLGRLLLSWVDEHSGELLFRWVNSAQAGRISEWIDPIYIPLSTNLNSSPYILGDDSGRILVGFAVPLNEQRGIYFVVSLDSGKSWSKPSLVFDAASAGWDMVDRPKFCVTGDGHLHVVFEKYSYQGDQRQSQGIYYSRTEDGGVTWSMPEAISEQPIFWSSIKCNNNQTLHRFWQEERQSEIVTYHQISDDGGISWGDAVVVSSQLDSDVLTDAIMDQDGNLHFLQLTGLDDTILVDHQKWDGFKWVTQGSNELSIKKTQAPISFSGVVASSGNMLISMIMEDSLQDSREKNQILSLNKFLGLPETTSDATTSIFIATPPAGGGISGGTPQPGQIPTQSSPLANLSDSASDLSRKRNIMGILLIFVAFVLVLVLVRPRSKKTG